VVKDHKTRFPTNTAFRLPISKPNLVCHTRTGVITVVLCSRACAYCATDKHVFVLLITQVATERRCADGPET